MLLGRRRVFVVVLEDNLDALLLYDVVAAANAGDDEGGGDEIEAEGLVEKAPSILFIICL